MDILFNSKDLTGRFNIENFHFGKDLTDDISKKQETIYLLRNNSSKIPLKGLSCLS